MRMRFLWLLAVILPISSYGFSLNPIGGVADKVKGTASDIKGTVGSVKDKVDTANDKVKQSIDNATGSIRDSHAVKVVSNTVTDTVDDTVLQWTEDGLRAVNIADVNITETIGFSANDDVHCFLYTRDNPTNATVIDVNDTDTLGYFNPLRETKIVTHGWMSSAKKMDKIRQAYMNTGRDLNVIMVDWEKGSTNALYNLAKNYVTEAGEYLAKVINLLVDQGLNPDNLHLIGHSLGAHISGVAANRSGVPIGKITDVLGTAVYTTLLAARKWSFSTPRVLVKTKRLTVGHTFLPFCLDPAAPLFGSTAAEDRLEPSDAKFVQIIHTCAGLLGWASPMGHVDFYPNGGTKSQPGCGLDTAGSCSHSRSHKYFTESINAPDGFRGMVCPDWDTFENGGCSNNDTLIMGEYTPVSARGVYYLATNESEPYALY